MSLPPANEVLGKVMFLHLCVILFGGGEVGLASQHASQVIWLGGLPSGGSASVGVCIQRRGVCIQKWVCIWRGLHPGVCLQGGLHPGGRPCPRDKLDTTGYGQQAGSMHPAGMHSCVNLKSKCQEWMRGWWYEKIWVTMKMIIPVLDMMNSQRFICQLRLSYFHHMRDTQCICDSKIQNSVRWHPGY